MSSSKRKIDQRGFFFSVYTFILHRDIAREDLMEGLVAIISTPFFSHMLSILSFFQWVKYLLTTNRRTFSETAYIFWAAFSLTSSF